MILEQPGQFAWQIFDRKVQHLLRDEYRIRQVTKVTANTIEELAAQARRRRTRPRSSTTIKEYNAAVQTDVPFNPEHQGRALHRRPRDQQDQLGQHASTQPPFEAYAVDLRRHLHLRRPAHRSTRAQVLDTDDRPIPGLYAAGELVGGLFYFNYPGGTGLMSGAVFGKIAGAAAAGADGGPA